MTGTTHPAADRSRILQRWLLTAALTALATAGLPDRAEAGAWQPATPVPGSVFDTVASQPPAQTRTCDERRQRHRRRGRVLGGVLGGIAGLAGGGTIARAALAGALAPAAGALLGEAIAGLLDCDEQHKAAAATEEAVRSGVGSTTSWTSTTRPGVAGSSTVTAAVQTADGGDCLMVTDVVIVDGEETRAPKRLCRRPPSTRYARV